MTRYLLLRIGDDRYAVDVARVDHVAPAVEPVALPLAPDGVQGLASYGRRIVPQMALSQVVSRENETAGGGHAVLVTTASGMMALRHDGFDGVRQLPDDHLAPVRAPVGDCRTGMMRLAGFRIFAIDTGRIRIASDVQPAMTLPGDQRPVRPDAVARTSEPEGPLVLEGTAGGRTCTIALDLVERLEAGVDGGTDVILRRDDRIARQHLDRVVGIARRSSFSAGDGGMSMAEASAHVDALHWEAADDGETAIDDELAEEEKLAVLLLRTGEERAAIPRGDVIRIAAARHWRPLDWVGGGMDGLVVVAGDVLPAVDLGRSPGARSTCVVIDCGDERWCLLCDHVEDPGSLPLDGPQSDDGVAVRANGRRISLLDIAHLRERAGAA